MELGARPHLEIAAQEYAVLPHGHAALAPVNGVARVGVDEPALGDDGAAPVRLGQLIGGRRRRKHEREQEEAKRHAEARAQHAAQQKRRHLSPPHDLCLQLRHLAA